MGSGHLARRMQGMRASANITGMSDLFVHERLFLNVQQWHKCLACMTLEKVSDARGDTTCRGDLRQDVT